MPREYKPRCCKDKALAVALFEEPRTPIRNKRKRPATVNSETTNKAAAVIIPTAPHPKGRILKKQNRKAERRSPRLRQAQNQHLLQDDTTVECKSRISSNENRQRVFGTSKNKKKRFGEVETDQLQQLNTTLENRCLKEGEEKDITASFGTISNNQLLHSSSFLCINDDVGDLQAGAKENIRDMVNGEEGGSLIRNENQEAAADVRLGNSNHKIDIMLHRTISSRSTRSRVRKDERSRVERQRLTSPKNKYTPLAVHKILVERDHQENGCCGFTENSPTTTSAMDLCTSSTTKVRNIDPLPLAACVNTNSKVSCCPMSNNNTCLDNCFLPVHESANKGMNSYKIKPEANTTSDCTISSCINTGSSSDFTTVIPEFARGEIRLSKSGCIVSKCFRGEKGGNDMKKKNHGGGNSSIDNDYDHRRRLDPVDIRIVPLPKGSSLLAVCHRGGISGWFLDDGERQEQQNSSSCLQHDRLVHTHCCSHLVHGKLESKNIISIYSAIDAWYQPPLHQSTKDCVTDGGLIDGNKEQKSCSRNIVVLVAVGLAHHCERREVVDECVEKKPIQYRPFIRVARLKAINPSKDGDNAYNTMSTVHYDVNKRFNETIMNEQTSGGMTVPSTITIPVKVCCAGRTTDPYLQVVVSFGAYLRIITLGLRRPTNSKSWNMPDVSRSSNNVGAHNEPENEEVQPQVKNDELRACIVGSSKKLGGECRGWVTSLQPLPQNALLVLVTREGKDLELWHVGMGSLLCLFPGISGPTVGLSCPKNAIPAHMHTFDVWSSADSLDPDDNNNDEDEEDTSCLTKDGAASLLLPVESISTMVLFVSLNRKELRLHYLCRVRSKCGRQKLSILEVKPNIDDTTTNAEEGCMNDDATNICGNHEPALLVDPKDGSMLLWLQKFKQGEVTELSLWCTNGKAMFHVTPAISSNIRSSNRQRTDEAYSMAVNNEALAARFCSTRSVFALSNVANINDSDVSCVLKVHSLPLGMLHH
eukprot:376850_1